MSSAIASSPVIESKKQLKEVSVPMYGEVVFKKTEEGVFKYTYVGKFLVEERTPGGTIIKYYYKDKKAIGAIRKLSKEDLVKKTGKAQSGTKYPDSQDKAGEEQFTTMNEACQIDEAGNLVNCSDWPEDSEPPGDGAVAVVAVAV